MTAPVNWMYLLWLEKSVILENGLYTTAATSNNVIVNNNGK